MEIRKKWCEFQCHPPSVFQTFTSSHPRSPSIWRSKGSRLFLLLWRRGLWGSNAQSHPISKGCWWLQQNPQKLMGMEALTLLPKRNPRLRERRKRKLLGAPKKLRVHRKIPRPMAVKGIKRIKRVVLQRVPAKSLRRHHMPPRRMLSWRRLLAELAMCPKQAMQNTVKISPCLELGFKNARFNSHLGKKNVYIWSSLLDGSDGVLIAPMTLKLSTNIVKNNGSKSVRFDYMRMPGFKIWYSILTSWSACFYPMPCKVERCRHQQERKRSQARCQIRWQPLRLWYLYGNDGDSCVDGNMADQKIHFNVSAPHAHNTQNGFLFIASAGGRKAMHVQLCYLLLQMLRGSAGGITLRVFCRRLDPVLDLKLLAKDNWCTIRVSQIIANEV